MGRPGIASFDLLMAGCDADAIGAWADSHPNDPLVPRALELETQIRADDLRIRVRAQTLPSNIAFGEDQKKPRRLFGVSPDTWCGAVWGGGLLSVVGCGVYLFAQSVLQPAATPAAQALRSGPSADVRFVPAHAGENGLSEAEAELRNHPLVYAAVKAAGKKASISRSLAKEAEALADAVDNGLAVDAPVGMAELADGSTYRGQMVDGRPGGIGVRTDPPKEGGAIFAGDMAKGLGTTTWPDGVSFSGAHVGGKPGGLGALHYVDGGMFEGGVDAKGRQGVGVLRDGDGEIVQGGRWKNDKLVSDYRNTG